MGGVCLTLYGFIAVSGLKMFKQVDLNQNKNLFTVAAILISGIGGLSLQIPYALWKADDQEVILGLVKAGQVKSTIAITSIATALLLGILTHFVCELIDKRNKPEEDAAPADDAQAE